MLEADYIDEDYFTPVPSTSLASIFTTSPKEPEIKDNESLKYTPSRQLSVAQKPDNSKITQCVFATALVGYEWVDNSYVCRGNLGFAIVKVLKSGLHNIILYDSRKNTLSRTAIGPTLEIIINNNNNKSMSYYDDYRKYWSLYVNEDCIQSIASLLESFNTQIKTSSHRDKNPPEPILELNKANTEEITKQDICSDTDSSINIKTKMTILSRMASMGQSVLPLKTNFSENTSDSSDTSENITQTKTFRHKPIKNLKKEMNTEKNTVLFTPQKMYESEQNQVALSTKKASDNTALYSYVNRELVPVTNANLIGNTFDRSINNMDHYFNEQRMNNTEMRINVNRITDKVDHILQKLNNIEEKDISGRSAINTQTSVYEKLLVEYENKIKLYEDLLKNKGLEAKHTTEERYIIHEEMVKKVQELKLNITELEQQNQKKTNEISRLDNELSVLQQKVDSYTSLNENIDVMSNKLKDLEVALTHKDLQLRDITAKYDKLLQSKNEHKIEDKIKTIMNNTYQTISGNFKNNESYSGATINKIIAVVIRNITLNMLNNDNTNPK